ncbi:MAG: NTP transferase domain-containing protein [Actinomycetes bacterium]
MNSAASQWQVVVLTGGGSRRMGRDKATLDVAGASLLDRTLAGVPADVNVVVAGPPVSVARDGVRFVQEVPPGGGPVAGLDAALTAVTAPVVVVLATDLPLIGTLPAALADALLRDTGRDPPVDGVLATDASGHPQQLCAAYRSAALRDAIAAGGTAQGVAMHSVLARLRTSAISGHVCVELGTSDAPDPTWDIDTPDDVQRLTQLLDETSTDSPGGCDG